MKRSEMVATLAIELMSRLPEWEKQERLNFASEILQCMEMEGMLPPPTTIFNTDDDNNPKWEPESE